jgi:hypothetical protein
VRGTGGEQFEGLAIGTGTASRVAADRFDIGGGRVEVGRTSKVSSGVSSGVRSKVTGVAIATGRRHHAPSS